MTDLGLNHLRELDPELADWWIERRRAAWSEVGLVRPEDADDIGKRMRDACALLEWAALGKHGGYAA